MGIGSQEMPIFYYTFSVWMEKGSIDMGVLDLGLLIDFLKNEM